MKLQIFLASFFLVFEFFIPAVLVNSQTTPSVSCDNCISDKQCDCQINDCNTGLVRIYTNNICSATASDIFKFSDNIFSWLPQKYGDFYFQASCDSGQTSSCSKISIGPPLFSCSNCNNGTCNCVASTCSKGTIDFYSSSDCSLIPYKESIFSGGAFSFPISKTTYMKIFCDDGSSSSCTTINYYPSSSTPTFSCSQCNTGTCICNVQGCQQGIFYFYSLSDCSGTAYQSTAFYGASFSFSINKNIAMKIYCNSGMTSPCMLIGYNPSSTTTSTSSTTTTTPIPKIECPYQCCSSDESYSDRDCISGYRCSNHICYVTTTSTTTVPYNINFSLVMSTFIAIILIIFLAYYVFGLILSRRTARWVGRTAYKE